MSLPKVSRPPVRFVARLLAATAGVSTGLHAQSESSGFEAPRVSFPSQSSLSRPLPTVRQPLFFPPHPPPLDHPVNRVPAPGVGRVPAAPPELAAFVNEIFYPALGARLASRSLTEALRRELDAYRAAKLALQRELREELARSHGAEPAARLQALATLARAQAPRLAQLERNAEQLRRSLTKNDQSWNALREWRLTDHDRRGFSPREIAQVMRAYAFEQTGLLPAQRRLLREISIELLLAADDPAKAAAVQPHVFFSPEPARVLFPENMPAAAAAKLAIYQTKKSVLKKELYDAIHAHDGDTFSFLKGRTMSALARKQDARLAELEAIAEEIRRLLPAVPEVAPPAERSPLPVALSTRISEMITRYTAAQVEAVEEIDAIVARTKSLPFQSSYRFDPDGLKFVVVPTRSATRDPDVRRKIEATRAEISAIAEHYGRTLAELLNERTAIQAEVAALLGPAKADAVEQTLVSAMRIAHQKQSEGLYDDYRIAVFQPGLSPEQRRLLFDGVVEKLALPLPRAELQPVGRANAW